MNTDGNLYVLTLHLAAIDAADELRDGDPCPSCDDGVIVVTPPEEDCPRGDARCCKCGERA